MWWWYAEVCQFKRFWAISQNSAIQGTLRVTLGSRDVNLGGTYNRAESCTMIGQGSGAIGRAVWVCTSPISARHFRKFAKIWRSRRIYKVGNFETLHYWLRFKNRSFFIPVGATKQVGSFLQGFASLQHQTFAYRATFCPRHAESQPQWPLSLSVSVWRPKMIPTLSSLHPPYYAMYAKYERFPKLCGENRTHS